MFLVRVGPCLCPARSHTSAPVTVSPEGSRGFGRIGGTGFDVDRDGVGKGRRHNTSPVDRSFDHEYDVNR